MSNFATPLTFVYITSPQAGEAVLNIRPDGTEELHRYSLTYKQLIALNAQIGSALEVANNAK